MRTSPVVTAALAGLVLAACGGNAADTATTRSGGSQGSAVATAVVSTDVASGRYVPCTLLTAQDATQALGGPVDPASTNDAQNPSCVYAIHSEGQPPDLSSVGIHLVQRATFDGTRQGAAAAGGHIDPAAGVGDEAYFEVIPGGGHTLVFLFVRRGDAQFYIALDRTGRSTQDRETEERVIAQAVVARLQ